MGNEIKEFPDEPKTPHEEVMFVVESTNDIVSEIKGMLETFDKKMTKLVEWMLKESERK